MRKNIFLVKSVLMSMLTAVTILFASCSDDMSDMSTNNDSQAPEGAETALLQPYGLTFKNFVTENDVQILNADTTEISVSKKLAEKLGITSFVNHPLGIWQAEAQLPYARLALAEKETSDCYILTVRRATVAEVIGNKSVTLNTDIHVNKESKSGTTRAQGIDMPDYAAKYVDGNEIIHPAYVHLTDPYGYDNDYHTDEDQPKLTRAASDGYQFVTADEIAGGQTRASAYRRILSCQNKIEVDKDFKFSKKEDASDKMHLNFTAETDFQLNYFITLDGDVRWHHLIIPDPYVEKFETGLEGHFAFNTEFTLGFKKEFKTEDDDFKYPIAKFSAYTFTFWVGPIPVCITCTPDLYMKMDGAASGALQFGIKYEYANHFKGGVRYQDCGGWSLIKEFDEEANELTFIKPEAQVHAEAGIGLYLGMDVLIYDAVGPEVAIGPRLGAEATVTLSPFDKSLELEAEVGLSVNAEIGAKLKVLGYEIAEYTKTFEIAGPWTLWKYPSDGSEHKSPAAQRSADLKAIINDVLKGSDPKVQAAFVEIVDMRSQMMMQTHEWVENFFFKEYEKYLNGQLPKASDKNYEEAKRQAAAKLTDYVMRQHEGERQGYEEWVLRVNRMEIYSFLENGELQDEINRLRAEEREEYCSSRQFDFCVKYFLNVLHREPTQSKEDLQLVARFLVDYKNVLYELTWQYVESMIKDSEWSKRSAIAMAKEELKEPFLQRYSYSTEICDEFAVRFLKKELNNRGIYFKYY